MSVEDPSKLPDLPKEDTSSIPQLTQPKILPILPKEDDSDVTFNSCKHSTANKSEIYFKVPPNKPEIKSDEESSSQCTWDYKKRSPQDGVFRPPIVPQKRRIERPQEHISFDKTWAGKRGSGGLAPSKSTIYLANLPFSLTNNDLHKILEKFGRCIKVSIPRDEQHRSKGVAFALFLEREPCIRVINTFNGKQLFGRTLKCSLAKDNGRAREFIRRKEYPDKSRCYECGEFGHLSYKCTKNVLGERRRPRKKKKKRIEKKEEDNYFDPDISLAQAIAEDAEIASECQEKEETSSDPKPSAEPDVPIYEDQDGNRYKATGSGQYVSYQTLPQQFITRVSNTVSSKRYQQDSYFSDEENLEED